MGMRWKRCLAWACALCLGASGALAAPDLRTLTYTAPAPAASPAPQASAPAEERVIPIDLWLDATPNVGGINDVPGTLYPTGDSAPYYQGGFHYRYADSRRSFQGWYVDLLCALPELLGPQRSALRVLRYDDGLFSAALLAKHGLPDTPAVQRDLRLWDSAATAQTFLDMVDPDPRSFYATGAQQAARAGGQALENPGLQSALAAAQAEGLARHRAGEDLADRAAGQSHFLTALQNLDPDRLNVITLDTWSLGGMTQAVDGRLVAPYETLLAQSGLLARGDAAMTVFALRLDYVGALTSFAWETPAEALQWGRLCRSGGIWRECAMPRCLLVFLVGRPGEVAELAGRLEALFAQPPFDAQRGFQDGDAAVTAVNYVYGDEKIMRTAFSFAYVREDLPQPQALSYQTQEDAAFTVNGAPQAADSPVVLTPNADGTYGDATLQWTLPLASAQGLDPQALAQGLETALAGSLTLQGTAPNTAENRAALAASQTQYVPYRDTLYLFAPLTDWAGAEAEAAWDGAQLQVTLRLSGVSLTPGWRTLRLTLTLPAYGRELPEAFAFLEDCGAAGDASAGKWSYSYTERIPAAWLAVPQALHDASAAQRAQLDVRHAWCDGNQERTLGLIPNVPPVFRLLQARELLLQLRRAALSAPAPLATLDATVFCQLP